LSHEALQIAHVSGEQGFSGGEVQVFLLLEGLRARGHRSVLVCPPGSESARQAEKRGFETHPVRMRNDLSLGAAWRIRRGLGALGVQLVHCHTGRANWLGGLAAYSRGLPAVTTRRMDRAVSRSGRNRWLYTRAMRRAVAISPAVERRLLEGGVPRDRVRLIWSSVDRAALRPSAPRAELRTRLGAGEGEACLLVAAHLVARKGIDVLLEAFAALPGEPPTSLWIAGEGPERVALESQALRLGCARRVHFLGQRDDVADLLEACDAFVLPSRAEGLGVAALEAMACGRPVVASAVGGLAEAVGHEQCGLLVPPDDAAALSAALGRLLGDAPLARRLGEAGAARAAERFDAKTMVAGYEALYREVLDEAAARGAR